VTAKPQTTALAKREAMTLDTALAVLSGAENEANEADRILAESEFDDRQSFDFRPSVLKVASSGAKGFTDETEEFVKAPLTCVILGGVKTRGLWIDDNNKIPMCSSVGGVYGITRAEITDKEFDISSKKFRTPHPVIPLLAENKPIPDRFPCAGCPMNEFGSALKGDGGGKACSEKRRLLVLLDGWYAPVFLTAPTMSIRPYETYASGLLSRFKTRIFGVRTQIDVVKMENRGGSPYGQLQFKIAERITDPDEAQAIVTLQRHFMPILEREPVMADEHDAPMGSDMPESAPAGESEVPW
jgi:hypothetical protein